MTSYNIKLPQFEGPFDLLLFFIERDELDIYNIPIATVTDDFLAYIRQLEALNLDLASEFILVAATLMRIKSKMLLPRREVDELGNEIDPRQELVERLLEYKRYKEIIDELRVLEEERAQKERRGNISDDLQLLANQALAEAEIESITLFRLLKAFERVMDDFSHRQRKAVHTVVRHPYTIEAQRAYVLDMLSLLGKADFKQVFETCENRIHAVHTFLAILELLQMGHIEAEFGEGANNFSLVMVEK